MSHNTKVGASGASVKPNSISFQPLTQCDNQLFIGRLPVVNPPLPDKLRGRVLDALQAMIKLRNVLQVLVGLLPGVLEIITVQLNYRVERMRFCVHVDKHASVDQIRFVLGWVHGPW